MSLANTPEKILDYIASMGSYGATSDEIVQGTGIWPQTVHARFSDLLLAGLIVKTGRRRRTQRGTKVAVCVVAPQPQPSE